MTSHQTCSLNYESRTLAWEIRHRAPDLDAMIWNFLERYGLHSRICWSRTLRSVFGSMRSPLCSRKFVEDQALLQKFAILTYFRSGSTTEGRTGTCHGPK